MTYQGFIKKSRTYDLAAIILLLGAVQAYVPDLGLSQVHTGIMNMAIAAAVAYLRHITTGPVGDK